MTDYPRLIIKKKYLKSELKMQSKRREKYTERFIQKFKIFKSENLRKIHKDS